MSADREHIPAGHGLRPTRREVLGAVGGAAALVVTSNRLVQAQAGLTLPTGQLTALTAQPGSVRLFGPSAPATDLLTYAGAVPGPVLKARLGQDLTFELRNQLAEPTSLAFGGYPVPGPMLGVPGVQGTPIAPSGSAQIRIPLTEPGTYIYAPFDIAQAARGLGGALIVEDPARPEADRDVTLFIQDWRVDPGQQVHLTVNGSPASEIPARAGERVRLRLVNATRGLFLPLRLDDHPAFIIAIDGRPAEPFPPAEGRLLMAPGGRVDVVVDLVKSPGSKLGLALEMPDGEVPLASLAYSAEAPLRNVALPPPRALPMADGGDQPKLAAAQRISLEFNDEPALAFRSEALAKVTPGTTIVATLTNRSSGTASIHLFGHAARLLDSMDDGWKPWWHDTVGLASGRTLRLALVARAPGRWPLVVRRGGDGIPLALAWFETAGEAAPLPTEPEIPQAPIPMPPKKPL